jgi:hypothetical protein
VFSFSILSPNLSQFDPCCCCWRPYFLRTHGKFLLWAQGPMSELMLRCRDWSFIVLFSLSLLGLAATPNH